MAMMAARGLHLNGGFSSHLSMNPKPCVRQSNGASATLAACTPMSSSMAAKKAAALTAMQIGRRTLFSTTAKPAAPVLAMPSLTSSGVASAMDASMPSAHEMQKENIDPFAHRRDLYRSMQDRNSLTSVGVKRKFDVEAAPLHFGRAPLLDITAQVLQRDYKVQMTDRHVVARIPSARASSSASSLLTSVMSHPSIYGASSASRSTYPTLPQLSAPQLKASSAAPLPTLKQGAFAFAAPALERMPKKMDRVIKTPVSPRKKALQHQSTVRALPVAPAKPFTFDFQSQRLVPSAWTSGGAAALSTPIAKPSMTSCTTAPASAPLVSARPTGSGSIVHRTSVKRDHLFDIQVQLGLMKPTAEQLKLKAPTTPFTAPKSVTKAFDPFFIKAASPHAAMGFALGRRC